MIERKKLKIDWKISFNFFVYLKKFYIFLTWKTSLVAENGNTATPTNRSATAKDTINKFVTERSFDEQNTAAITKQLPAMTITLIKAKTDRDKSSWGSLQLTSSRRAAHADALSVFRITFNLNASIVVPKSE